MKAAIIGCGQIGQRHAHNFARLGYDVATWDAIADRCTASYASEACDGASLAIIATPPDIHCIGALQVYEWGVPWILIEKPLNAGPLFEVKTLSKMLDKRMVFVGYCLRFALATCRLLQADLGHVRYFEATYCGPIDARQTWLKTCHPAFEYSHILDLILQLWGMPDEIESIADADGLVAVCGWNSGLRGTLRMDYGPIIDTRLRIFGDVPCEWRRESIIGLGDDETVEDPRAYLLHEAQELHALITGTIPKSDKLCTLDEAIRVVEFAERLLA